MVREKKLYDMHNKAKDDKQQIRFGAKAEVIQPKPAEITQFTTVNCNEPVMCPFCLHRAKLSSFFISTKKGISQGKAQCPECHNGMLMKSLWAQWTLQEYAEWVFKYAKMGFWQKCPFHAWKERLRAIGWSYEFWKRYRDLKGSGDVDAQFNSAEEQSDYYDKRAAEYEAANKESV